MVLFDVEWTAAGTARIEAASAKEAKTKASAMEYSALLAASGGNLDYFEASAEEVTD